MGKRFGQIYMEGTALAAYVGEPHVFIVNSTSGDLHITDGTTPGGIVIARADGSNIALATDTVKGLMSATQYQQLAQALIDIDSAEAAIVAIESDVAALTAITVALGALANKDTVASADIDDGAITNSKYADASITKNKIDPSVELGGPSIGARSFFRYNMESMSANETLWENNVTATVDNTTNVVNVGTDDGFADNDRVNMITTGTMPSGIDTTVTYYVVSVTTTTLQLSLTRGGAAIAFTDNGTGTHTLYRPIMAAHFGDLDTESFDLVVPNGSDLVVI